MSDNNNCIVCGKEIINLEEATSVTVDDDCNPLYSCSDECTEKHKTAEVAEEMAKAKADATGFINYEFLPTLKLASEICTENKDEVIAAIAPIAQILGSVYKELLTGAVSEGALLNAQAIDETIQALIARGYTRDEAIRFLTK
jgi:hypothetical protein